MVKHVENLNLNELLIEYHESLPLKYERVNLNGKHIMFRNLTDGINNVFIGKHGGFRIGKNYTKSLSKEHLLTEENKQFMRVVILTYREIKKRGLKI